MNTLLVLLHSGRVPWPRSARSLTRLSIMALVLAAVLAPESALADGEDNWIDPEQWTRIVLAAVRVILWILGLPPIQPCTC